MGTSSPSCTPRFTTACRAPFTLTSSACDPGRPAGTASLQNASGAGRIGPLGKVPALVLVLLVVLLWHRTSLAHSSSDEPSSLLTM
uniref:Uncharacterized protein n=1 Tax=Arundo donax TaxID=35708 RepID=A0A0A8ZIK9_ARUDO